MPRSKDTVGEAATVRQQRFCSPAARNSHIEEDEESPIATTCHRLRLLSEPASEVVQGAATGEAVELRELIRALRQRQIANAHVETDELPPAA